MKFDILYALIEVEESAPEGIWLGSECERIAEKFPRLFQLQNDGDPKLWKLTEEGYDVLAKARAAVKLALKGKTWTT